MSNNTYNVWIQISNGQDREFVFHATSEEVDNLREFLANREHVKSFDIAEEFIENDANDVKEELGQWIADEVE